MNISFKAFAAAKDFTTFPVSALAVAKSLNMSPPPPVSMRAMIATLAPSVPSNLDYNQVNGQAMFYWFDPEAPTGIPPKKGDPLRAATSFEFKLWSNQVLIDDAILPLSYVLLTNGGMAYSPAVLDGSYVYQIIAINAFGSAATSELTAQFSAPAKAPNITVARASAPPGTPPAAPNSFNVIGANFDAYNGQSLFVIADTAASEEGTKLNLTQVSVPVKNGGFNTSLECGSFCAQAGRKGTELRFFVSQSAPAVGTLASPISNLFTGLSCS